VAIYRHGRPYTSCTVVGLSYWHLMSKNSLSFIHTQVLRLMIWAPSSACPSSELLTRSSDWHWTFSGTANWHEQTDFVHLMYDTQPQGQATATTLNRHADLHRVAATLHEKLQFSYKFKRKFRHVACSLYCLWYVNVACTAYRTCCPTYQLSAGSRNTKHTTE
jgi:hypothetical protein